MASELDRVRISAAELRALASNSVDIPDCHKEDPKVHLVNKQHRKSEGKHHEVQRYQPVAGHGRCHRDSDGGEPGQSDPLASNSLDHGQPSQIKKRGVLESHGCTKDVADANIKEEDRMRGDGSNTQTCRKGFHSQSKSEANKVKVFVENDREHEEAAGGAKPMRKARKPDREFYQPGSRRSIQGKDSAVGKEEEMLPTRQNEQKTDPESVLNTGGKGGNKKGPVQKQAGKAKEVNGLLENIKSSKSTVTNRNHGSRGVEESPLPSDASVDIMTNKVEQLSVKEKDEVGCEGQVVEELSSRRETIDKERRDEGGGTKEEEEKVEKKKERGNRRRRGGDKEKERNQDSRRKEDEAGGGGKSDQRKAEMERDRRETDRDNKAGQTGFAQPNKREENRRGGDNNNQSRAAEKDDKTGRSADLPVERGNRHRSNANVTTTTSKRYSKSDIRRSRNRTYSSSSASSVTSLDGPRLGMVVESTRLALMHNNKEGPAKSGVGRRSNLQSWTANGESSTESPEGSERSDKTEDRKRRRGVGGDLSAERRREERNRPKGNNGGRGIFRVSIEQTSGTASYSGTSQQRKPGVVPRGRGGGILVLPARTDISNSPEVGQRLLFGGIRGGGACRSRGGRGGVRRLWDPNNPDQKPALASTQSSQHVSLKQPVYLQTGTGYGQLHFLDTDDEVAGSPPVPQGEHFRTQQAAAMAFYKFQNSDNPYCYPMSTSNSHSPGTTTNQRYPYPYGMGPYQMAPPNGMYPVPGVGQFCGSYRGAGYSQLGAGGNLTLEEVQQQARGELGRLLRSADAQELQLSNLLSRDRVSADGLDRMTLLRADLLGVYEQIILTDIDFSDSQNVDQSLWKNVFYQVIERFRQLLKDPTCDNTPHIRNLLLTLLDEGALFFDGLLQKLQTVYQFKLDDYMDGMAIRARPLRKTVKYALISAQRCMICQGDIARYREQASDSANYGKARSWYLKAQQIAPKNGRPYNQLALLAVYTKRKLDAVYYYMRSLAASNPILTAKESLMSLFEEAKRKDEQLERRRRQEHEGGSRGPAVRGRGRGEDGARREIWIRRQAATPSSQRGGSESSRDSEQDGELGSMSASDLNKRFILSFLHAHGKLFTKVGMESFPRVASRVLQKFKTLLQHGPSLLGFTHMLQIITINMFTIQNAHSRGEVGEVRSVLQEQSTALGLGMFALMVQRCTELLRNTPAAPVPVPDAEEQGKGEELEGMVRVSAFSLDLKELLPSIKVWSDWMLGQPDQWNPPPCTIDGSPDVWQCLADLCNMLARVDHEEVPLYTVDTEEVEGDEELTVLQLKEDQLLAGFVPLLAAPQEPCYSDRHTDVAIAADCKRVTVLKYFLEALCGQEEPLLAFKGGKYVSVAFSPPTHSMDTRSRQDSLTEKEGDDVIVEAESSFSASEGEDEAGDSENDIRQLKARRNVLTNKLAQQQKRRDKIQAVLQTSGQLELEVRPHFLVPDTNGFIDHLGGLKKLLQCGTYIIVVPLIVITELDGLAKGQDNFGGGVCSGGRGAGGRGNCNVNAAHVRAVQEKARLAVAFLEKGFEAREPSLRALTSRGNQLESISFRSEDTSGQQGTNDDVILSCCLHYCKDKAKDSMPDQKNGTVRLQREVVLLTDDRNLRVKALTRNVPVRDIPAFLSWAKVG